jgi:hypothetical protein
MTETAVVICVALCMFLEGELVEHTYKGSMAECLKAKRTAERNIQPERVQFKCGKNVKAEVEYIKAEGQTAARTRILRVIEHGYTSDSYDAESKY